MTEQIPYEIFQSIYGRERQTDLQEKLDTAIPFAAEYMKNVRLQDGRFHYRLYNDRPFKPDNRYNVLRHLGAIYALASYLERYPNAKGYRRCLTRATEYILQKRISPLSHDATIQCVWSWPSDKKLRADAEPYEAKLGAAGLALLALCRVERLVPGSVTTSILQGLASFIRKMQRKDGSFTSIHVQHSGPHTNFTSLFYPGEAILGLMQLYEIDENPEWLKVAAKAMTYLAKSRATHGEYLPDHWALIAMPSLMRHYHRLETPPTSRQNLEVHMKKVVEVILDSFENSPRLNIAATPVATRFEGCLAYLSTFSDLDTQLTHQIVRTLDSKIEHLLKAQITKGPFIGGIMREIKRRGHKGNRRSQEIRIDYNQHWLSACMQFQDLFILGNRPIEFQPKTNDNV